MSHCPVIFITNVDIKNTVSCTSTPFTKREVVLHLCDDPFRA